MRATTCVHYLGSGNLEDRLCARGIDVRQRFQPLWPCWTGNAPPKSSAVCPFFQAPTPEQIAEHQAKAQAGIQRMLAANVAIWEWEEKQQTKERPLTGNIPCPTCKAPMYVLITTTHLYAQCETKLCTNFRGTCR